MQPLVLARTLVGPSLHAASRSYSPSISFKFVPVNFMEKIKLCIRQLKLGVAVPPVVAMLWDWGWPYGPHPACMPRKSHLAIRWWIRHKVKLEIFLSGHLCNARGPSLARSRATRILGRRIVVTFT